jgi:hypothetical protein
MKKHLTHFQQNLETRAVRKIRLRHTRINQILLCYHTSHAVLSHFAACDQNIDLRAGSNPAGGVESQICIQKGDYVFFLIKIAVLRTLEHPARACT